MSEYPFDVAKYHEGIALFNDVEFFEAHDAWEELWQEYHGDDRKFFQGLIQVAVCLHHFGNGNIRGKTVYLHTFRAIWPHTPVVTLSNLLKN